MAISNCEFLIQRKGKAMTNIFDTHAHYSSRQFDADRDAVMRALGEGGIYGEGESGVTIAKLK